VDVKSAARDDIILGATGPVGSKTQLQSRAPRGAAQRSGYSGLTGTARASGGSYHEVPDDSRGPTRLIRDLFNKDDLDGSYWNAQAEVHICEAYPNIDWSYLFDMADEPYIADEQMAVGATTAYVYAAVAENNEMGSANELNTNKEAYPDDEGKIPGNEIKIPGSYDEAVHKSPQKEYWKAAIQVEIEAQIKNKTVVEIPIGNLPDGINLIDGTWKFDAKVDPETGRIRRYKARFCGRGDMQVPGVDYFETSSPVVSYNTLRIIIALSCIYGWLLRSMDISTAYLNATLDEPVYMRPGKGFKNTKGTVWKVLKGLYGTCQAGRAWWQHFHSWIKKDPEVTPCTVDPCVYIFFNTQHPKHFVILMLYVDDLITSSNNPAYHEVIQMRMESLHMG